MTQTELNRAVALATGESVCTVSERGFSIADPDRVHYDPEPSNIEDRWIDWDDLEAGRRRSVLSV